MELIEKNSQQKINQRGQIAVKNIVFFEKMNLGGAIIVLAAAMLFCISTFANQPQNRAIVIFLISASVLNLLWSIYKIYFCRKMDGLSMDIFSAETLTKRYKAIIRQEQLARIIFCVIATILIMYHYLQEANTTLAIVGGVIILILCPIGVDFGHSLSTKHHLKDLEMALEGSKKEVENNL